MTLFKQLMLLITLFSALVLSALLYGQLHHQQSFMDQQQRVYLDGARTGISAMAKPWIQLNDIAGLEAALVPLFDSGQFRTVEVIDKDNVPLWRKQMPPTSGLAPDWFANLGWFTPIRVEAQIQTQWQTLAKVVLITDPSIATQALWIWIQKLMVSAVISWILLLIGIATITRKLLAPLKEIRDLGELISHQGQPKLDALKPAFTKEIASVQSAFLKVAEQFQRLYQEQAQETERIRTELYLDESSGLGNRTMVDARLILWQQEKNTGFIALLDIPLLQSSLAQGPSEYRAQLQNLKSQLIQGAPLECNLELARLNNTELMLFVADVDTEQRTAYLSWLNQSVSSLAIDPLGISAPQFSIAVLTLDGEAAPADALSCLDTMLISAKQSGQSQVVKQASGEHSKTRSKQQWLQLVNEALTSNRLNFREQAAMTLDGELLHYELYTALGSQNNAIYANQFLPALEGLGKTTDFDRYVISYGLSALQNRDDTLAINLCLASVIDPGFCRWLKRQLTAHQSIKRQLVIELPELLFVKHPDAAWLFCQMLKELGFSYAIDQLGRHVDRLDYLNALPKAKYVKLDLLYSKNIDDKRQQDLLLSLCRTVHNIEIPAIATNVEDSAQLALFTKLQLDGVQGHVSETWQEVASL